MPLPHTCTTLLVQQALITFYHLYFTYCYLGNSNKSRSCRRRKNTDKYACARDQIGGLFGAVSPNSQVWRIICTNKKICCQTCAAVLCLASHYKLTTAVLNKPILFLKSGIARKFCTLTWTSDGSVPSVAVKHDMSKRQRPVLTRTTASSQEPEHCV